MTSTGKHTVQERSGRPSLHPLPKTQQATRTVCTQAKKNKDGKIAQALMMHTMLRAFRLVSVEPLAGFNVINHTKVILQNRQILAQALNRVALDCLYGFLVLDRDQGGKLGKIPDFLGGPILLTETATSCKRTEFSTES